MFRFLLLFSLFSSFIYSQNTIGVLSNLPSSFDGYTLFNSSGDTNTYLIDNCGYKMHTWHSEYRPNLSVYLLENGNLLRSTRRSGNKGFEILDWQSNVVWSYIASPSLDIHHDIEMLPNGNVIFLGRELIPAADVISQGGPNSDRNVDIMIEIDTSTSQIVWQWSAWDHLIQDVDSLLPNYGVISNNPQRMDVNKLGTYGNPNGSDWLHANSIDYNADLDQIIINFAKTGEFWIIDHSTTMTESQGSIGGLSNMGGDILYRWGNAKNYQRGTISDVILEFQHDSHWIPNGYVDAGKVMIFNNGKARGYSSVDLISLPLDSVSGYNYIIDSIGPYSPSAPEWSYSDSANFYSGFISGAQRLENGNTLVCSGEEGHIFEVEHLTDSIVWSYIIPLDHSALPQSQGDLNIISECFRATRYSFDYDAFDNITLVQDERIELNSFPDESFDTLIVNNSILWNDMNLTISGDYLFQLPSSNGCDSTANLNLTILNNTSIIDNNSNDNYVIKVVDLFGRTVRDNFKQPLYYIYKDGTVEKRFIIK